MKKRRVKFVMEFEADLDMVPGWGHQPIDWVEMARGAFVGNASHYNTKAELVVKQVEVDGYATTNLGGDRYDFYDPKMTIENALHDVHVSNWFDDNPEWDGTKFPIPRPWIVRFADNSVEAYETEDDACDRQQQWRRSIGLDEMTGEKS